MPQFKFFSFSI